MQPVLIRHDDSPASGEMSVEGIVSRSTNLAQRIQVLEAEIEAKNAQKEAVVARRTALHSCGEELQQCVQALGDELESRKRSMMPQATALAELDAELRLGSLVDAESKPLQEAWAERDIWFDKLRNEEQELANAQDDIQIQSSRLSAKIAELESVSRGAAAIFVQWHRHCQELESIQFSQQSDARKLAENQSKLSKCHAELASLRRKPLADLPATFAQSRSCRQSPSSAAGVSPSPLGQSPWSAAKVRTLDLAGSA